MTIMVLSEGFLRNYSTLSQYFLMTFPGLYLDFPRTFSELPQGIQILALIASTKILPALFQ